MIGNRFYAINDEEKDKHGGRGGAICSLGLMMMLAYFTFWVAVFPDWTHSAWQLEDNLMGRVKRFNGVFLRCISPKQGAFKCDNYGNPTFAVQAELQAQRALIILAVLFSFIGIIIGMLSLQCTTMIDNSSKVKSYIGMASGFCLFLSGTCTLIPTIWFGVSVHRRYYDPAYKNDSFKYEYGACLYVGWVTGVLTVISGLVLIIGSCKDWRNDEPDSYQPAKPYVYKPPTSTFAKPSGEKTEYV